MPRTCTRKEGANEEEHHDSKGGVGIRDVPGDVHSVRTPRIDTPTELRMNRTSKPEHDTYATMARGEGLQEKKSYEQGEELPVEARLRADGGKGNGVC